MGALVTRTKHGPRNRHSLLAWVAGGAAAALAAGMIIFTGIGAETASAAPQAPKVSTSPQNPPLVAGEAGTLGVTFTNEAGTIGEFNLSAMLVIPQDVTVEGDGGLGMPTQVYTSADGALPSAYSATEAECEAMGLVAATMGKCAVPAGMQLFLFENFSDLPETASTTFGVSVIPDAAVFEPGVTIPYVFTAFTSDDPNFFPVFPGSTSKAVDLTHTSARGTAKNELPIEALRVSKSEPSPEAELLRGAHHHQTVYTLNIAHTGEGDITGAKVVDYLPAGLEYMGSGLTDNTLAANGNGGIEEYSAAGSLSVGTAVAHWFAEESIVTVQLGAAEADELGLPGAGVYTKVTWDLSTLLQTGGTSNGVGEVTSIGVPQSSPTTAGTAGVITLQYVAAVPLFENTYVAGSFDEHIGSTHGALGQGSNLDNNSGASTRHGDALGADPASWLPSSLTNTATASGDYQLKHPRDGENVYQSSATGSHAVEVVDVRLQKTVDDSVFVQGGLAEYTLTIATSEYVEARLADAPGSSSSVRPNRLVDDFADGICPAFPADVQISPGASTLPGLPNLRLGNPANGAPARPEDANMTPEAWKLALGEDLADCAFPSAAAGAKLDGATLTGIAYDPASGHFYADFWIDDLGSSEIASVSYTARQNDVYAGNNGRPGGTSSGDVISNRAEVLMLTTPIAATADIKNAVGNGVGTEFRAAEDSSVHLRAVESGLRKDVLPRSAGIPSATEITDSSLAWEKDLAPEPFAAGDEVWYRLSLELPNTADVRNPKLSDFLPQGVELPPGWPNTHPEGGFTDYVIVTPTSFPDYGMCKTSNRAGWLNAYFGNSDGVPEVDGNLLTWTLGSNECVTGNNVDRFLPIESSITVYIKAVVVGTSAASTQDLPQNLAKYQQQARINEDGEREIFFLRDAAEIELVTTPKLVKGIETNSFGGILEGANGFATVGDEAWKGTAPGPNYPAGSSGNSFWSNIDGEYAVQKDEITFRIDVQSPSGNKNGSVATSDYVVWDALPVGVTKADLAGFTADHRFSASAVPVINGVEGAPYEAADFTAQVYDYADYNVANPPAGLADLRDEIQEDQRSVIVWTLKPAIPGSQAGDPAMINGFSLFYTVVIPSDTSGTRRDALLEQQYTNTASIVQYNALTQTSTGDSTTALVPFGGETLRDNGAVPADLPAGAKAVPQDETFDSSHVMIPNVAMRKTLVSTEIPSTSPALIDPQNGVGVIVQGEYASYDISVTVPANTTVRGGVLSDSGALVLQSGGGSMSPGTAQYQVKSATLVDADGASVALPNGFTLNPSTGVLTFPEYHQTADTPETFTVRLVVWMKDRDATHTGSGNADRPQIGDGTPLRNTAHFDSKNVTGEGNPRISDTADVTYREPNPTLSKTTVGTLGGADGNVTFRLTAGNSSNRPALYDTVVYDCLPAGFSLPAPNYTASQGSASVTAGGCTTTGTGANSRVAAGGGSGTLIAWQVGQLSGGGSATLTFTAKIDATAGGGASYTNRAQITGFTLPAGTSGLPDAADRRGDRVTGAERAVSISSATIAKTVTTPNGLGSAPIGETVRYTVKATLPANANFYDVRLTDVLPTGVTYAGNQAVTLSGWATQPTVTGPTNPSSQNLAWNIAPDDIPLHTAQRTITIAFDAKITDSVTATAPRNTANLSWNVTNNTESTRRSAPPATADVTILNPALQIVKKVDGLDSITRNPHASFDYTLTVNQTTQGNTPAHSITVQDLVPTGVIVDESTITSNGTLSGAGSNGGGTITWQLAGPLNPAGSATATSIELRYSAEFADSTTLSATALENVANVTHFESFAGGGRSYNPPLTGTGSIRDTASVTPLFPMVDPVKTVTNPVAGTDYGLAYVDTPFGWTLTITNNGDGAAASANVVDTLPENWSYVAGTAKVNSVALADPTQGTASGKTTLTWTTAQLQAAIVDLFPLAAGTDFAITFSALPNPEAIDAPGTGLPTRGSAHINTVSVINVTDTQSNDENAAGDYAGEDDTANAYIAEADLLLEKTVTGGITADIELSNGETLPQGSWIAGAVADDVIVPATGSVDAVTYVQPKWQLTVTNHGPDASFGPFGMTEQQTLPEGVTVNGWEAHYFATATSAGAPIPVTVTGSGANLSLSVGDAATSLKADGSDRIVITANVNVPAGVTATADQLKNRATVEGGTFERESNRVPGAKNPNEAEAGKALGSVADLAIEKAFASVTGERNAGDLINWTLTVTNNGPDHSLSTSGAGNQIVVVDAVPDEIADPETLNVPTGWEVAQDGNTFTFTLLPESQFTSGTSFVFNFSGRIAGDVAADTEIANTATVTAGETPDPYTPNNEDEDTTHPVTAHTSVAASKERVVLKDGQWVSATGDVTAGDTVSYRLKLTNTGSYVPARGVTLSDSLASYLSLQEWVAQSPSTGWSLAQTGRTLTFSNPSAVAPGDSASVILTVKVAADYRDAVVNTVCVDTGNLDPAQSTNDDCATNTTDSDKSVDWELLKTHISPGAGENVAAGETVRYRLVLNNNGPSISDGPITITDVLPAGFSYAGNAVVAGATLSDAVVTPDAAGDQIVWTADGPFAVGAAVVTVEFDALVAANAAPGSYENDARVDGPRDEPDTNPGNNDDQDEVTVIRDAQMHIDKQVLSAEETWGETAEHLAGTSVTWRVNIANAGPSAAPVTFTDNLTLAPGVTLTAIDGGSDWECDTATQGCDYIANGGLHPVTLDDESNASWITITTFLASNVPPTEAPGLVNWGKIVWTDSTVDADLPDGGNSASDDANITTVRSADLGIVKQVRETAPDGEWIDADSAASAGTVTAGLSTSYRVVVRNEGPSDAIAPLIVNDTLPVGATFEGLVSSPEWTAVYNPDSNSVTLTRAATYGGLAVDAIPLTIEYEVSFDATLEAGEVLLNSAELDAATLEANSDTNADNDSDPANVVVERQIDLGIVKHHDPAVVRIGDVLPFTVEVTNYGPSEATGISVTDTVPAGLEVLHEADEVLLGSDGLETGWVIETVEFADIEDPAAGATVIARYLHPIAPGESAAPLVIDTRVTAAAYDTVTNVVGVIAHEPEPDPDIKHPNTAEDPVVVPSQVTLMTEKTAVGEFQVGKTGTYLITVENLGPTVDPGPIKVTDALPNGLSYHSSPDLPAGVAIDMTGTTVVWTLEDGLRIGEKVTFTLLVNVQQGAYPEVTNTVVVDTPSEVTPDSVLTGDVTVQVKAMDVLSVTGSAAVGYLAILAALLMLGGAVLAGVRRRSEA